MVDLSIIIVSWNVADLLEACLRSIETNTDELLSIEIIVVDSASGDDSVARVRRDFPDVVLLPQSENLGFTRSNNIGLERATGRHLMLLNPDTEIIGDALPQLVTYLDDHPDVGIVGPHTLNTDGTTQSSRRLFPTKTIAFFESTWLQSYAPKNMLETFYLAKHPDNTTFDVDWMQGSALMVRREVYEQIGELDTGFIMYFEELDWCKRAKEAGWRAVYVGTAQIIHHGGKSTEQANPKKHIYFQQSKLRYYAKYHGTFFAFLLRLFLMTSYLLQMLIEAVKGIVGSKRALRKERVHTYWQVLRSGLKGH